MSFAHINFLEEANSEGAKEVKINHCHETLPGRTVLLRIGASSQIAAAFRVINICDFKVCLLCGGEANKHSRIHYLGLQFSLLSP